MGGLCLINPRSILHEGFIDIYTPVADNHIIMHKYAVTFVYSICNFGYKIVCIENISTYIKGRYKTVYFTKETLFQYRSYVPTTLLDTRNYYIE